jgi:F420-0:gamma-glutamyl ligase
MGEAAEGRPAAVVRGLKGLCDLERPGAPRGASALQRLPEKDLFR